MHSHVRKYIYNTQDFKGEYEVISPCHETFNNETYEEQKGKKQGRKNVYIVGSKSVFDLGTNPSPNP